MNVGTLTTFFFGTTGCSTSQKPVSFSVVAGAIPPGMTLFTQGVASGGITGRPTAEGVFRPTIRVKDQTGATDTEVFEITVLAARPVVITNQTDALNNGVVGPFYCCGNLFADGGTPGYTWTLRSGALPPGLHLQASPGRITGTPTTAGVYSFLARDRHQGRLRRAHVLDHGDGRLASLRRFCVVGPMARRGAERLLHR